MHCFACADGPLLASPPPTALQVSNGLSPGANLAILFGICIGTRALAFVFVYLMARFRKL